MRARPPRSLVAVRGAVIVPLARCAMRGCPFRWPADTGRRVCPDHDDDSAIFRAAESLGIDWAAVAAEPPDGRGRSAQDGAAQRG